jgi:hypothetical protein
MNTLRDCAVRSRVNASNSINQLHWIAFSLAAIVLALILSAGSAVAAQTPYLGTPTAVPGTWEAENFDAGGEGVAYHDNVVGNAGGQYRPSENVDIIVSADSLGGGYVVQNFETGEWLEYTINVPTAALYNIEIRASNFNWSPQPAFRVEIIGRGDVTGNVAIPNTGGWDIFQWVGKNGVFLAAGQQVLRIVSVQQYFNLNSIRITAAPSPTPYTGTPIPIPGTWEAENFDLGGEGVAYHDNAVGNAGGQYRPSENVDLFVSNDSAGGAYIVRNFENGEWLNYTINVPTAGNYDVELRVATNFDFPDRSYRLELDGTPVPGTVVLPDTGGWTTYQWAGKKTIFLSAGQHLLKVVSVQQYFDLNQIRVVATTTTPPPPNLLFRSGFEGTVSVSPVVQGNCWPTGCWQDITGPDGTTSFSWPPNIWGGGGRFQLLADASVNAGTIGNYMVNRIETTTGHNGSTKALYSEIKQSGCCGTAPQGGGATQDPFMLLPATEPSGTDGDLYISYWMKFQSNMANLMQVGTPNTGWNWRAFFEWKTAGDYRVIAQVLRDPFVNGGQLYWHVRGDTNANGGVPLQTFWEVNNTAVAVPVGQWFKFEVFWHRSRNFNNNGGRVWMAVNGQVIANVSASTLSGVVCHTNPCNTSMTGINNARIDRIFVNQVYSSTAYPLSQWVDDVQIWRGFPTVSPGSPWDDPPYAPH